MDLKFLQRMTVPSDSKIVMLILDGLGGLEREPGGMTELETARTPKLDALASRSALGFTLPVGQGITAGSGPGHLGIFGYDPIEYEIGRGALEALGVDFDLHPKDVAARGNFCTVDQNGILTDRRAGRLDSAESRKLIELLRQIKLQDADFFVEVIKEHRFSFVLRGDGLGASVSETDPLKTGVLPLKATALSADSILTAALVNEFIAQAGKLLAEKSPANMILLRGFDRYPTVPSFKEVYKLNAAAIAINGMYKGVSRLVGMQVLDVDGVTVDDEISLLEKRWQDFDFFYIHVKETDTAGEDGDFDRKVRVIEHVDSLIPRIMALNPDVVLVGGDHSSPAVLKFHSWHPVPVLLYGRYVRADGIREFGERACLRGSLGTLPAKEVMPLVLANAKRLAKYGA